MVIFCKILILKQKITKKIAHKEKCFALNNLKELFIASYYRKLPADIKKKNYKIKTSFVDPEGPKANKAGINFMTFIIMLVKIQNMIFQYS